MTNDDRARVLRAMRGWLGEDQAAVAAGAGLSEGTLIAAERARACSDKTWTRALAWFETRGLIWVEEDDEGPASIVIE